MTKKLTGKTLTGIALRDVPTPHDDARRTVSLCRILCAESASESTAGAATAKIVAAKSHIRNGNLEETS
jgi:hypothetical protein